MRVFGQRVVLGLIFYLCSSLMGESLPLELWYGYIPGGSRASVALTEAKDELARYDISFGGGPRRLYEWYIPSAFLYFPERNGKKLYRHGPLTGAVQLGRRIRYRLHEYAYRWADYLQGDEKVFHKGRRDTWSLRQAVTIWSSDSVSLDTQSALYQYLEGPWLRSGQITGTVALSLRQESSESESQSAIVMPGERGESHYISINSKNLDSISAEFSIGAHQRLQVGLSLEHFRHSNPQFSFSNGRRFDTLGVFLDSFRYQSTTRSRTREWLFAPRLTYLPLKQLWLSISANYRRQRRNGNQDTYVANNYLVESSLQWISRIPDLKARFLLDNFNGYYGQPLPSGTFFIDLHSKWAKLNAWQRFCPLVSDESNSCVTMRVGERRQLEVRLTSRYYNPPYSQFEMTLHMNRELSTGLATQSYRHRQDMGAVFSWELNNIIWHPDNRREISWSEIKPIDYVLGPLLRRGDYRLRMEVVAPTYFYVETNARDKLYEFFKGESDRAWQYRAKAAVGVARGLQAELSIYRYRASGGTKSAFHWENRRWSNDIGAKWQPLNSVRLTVIYQTSSEQEVGWDGERLNDVDDWNTWHLSAAVDILIPDGEKKKDEDKSK